MAQVQTAITFTADDGFPLPGVLTVPDAGDGRHPALVMIYEAFGMNDEMRRVDSLPAAAARKS